MEELLRGYLNTAKGQSRFYFENTVSNIANFIYQNAAADCEVIVETLFGKELLKTVKQGFNLQGKPSYVEKIQSHLNQLQSGETAPSEVVYLDLQNINDRDEFDSKDITEKEFVRLYDGH